MSFECRAQTRGPRPTHVERSGDPEFVQPSDRSAGRRPHVVDVGRTPCRSGHARDHAGVTPRLHRANSGESPGPNIHCSSTLQRRPHGDVTRGCRDGVRQHGIVDRRSDAPGTNADRQGCRLHPHRIEHSPVLRPRHRRVGGRSRPTPRPLIDGAYSAGEWSLNGDTHMLGCVEIRAMTGRENRSRLWLWVPSDSISEQ